MSKFRSTKSTGHIVYSTHPGKSAVNPEETPTVNPVKSGEPIRIYTEKRSGCKIVTLIKNIPCRNEELHELLQALKKNCAAGGTVRERTMELQGDQKKKVSAELIKLGYKIKAG